MEENKNRSIMMLSAGLFDQNGAKRICYRDFVIPWII